MRILGNIIGGLLILLILAAFGAYTWFWWKPVGVNNYINRATGEFLLDSPELLSQLGVVDNTPLDFHSGKLDDYTKASEVEGLEKLRRARATLDKYGPEGLDGQELLSWKITAWFFDDLIRQGEFEYSGYRVNQISGPTVNLPSFLTDTHVIQDKKSIKRYLSRINEFGRVLRETKARVEDDRDNGLTPPDFIIEKALVGMRSFVDGGADANPLVTTLPAKLDKIEGLTTEEKSAFVAEAKAAVESRVIPGYEAMIALFEELLTTATHDAGVWRLPDGDKIYATALKSFTTTDLSADEVHDIGVTEVARIEAEMNAILVDAGYAEGTVAERVETLMNDPDLQFPNTDEGREALIAYLYELNEKFMAMADAYFITLPSQPLEIVRVPEYRQDSAPGGYYNPPALDGSRPGRFYINLKDTADNPRWTLPTLLYHEAAPGHHFQLSSAQLITGVPVLRRVSPFSAYAEGWALYCERLVKEIGLYDDDPLGDLGRLQAEMFRAVRLVVDTGMHHKRWSREEAIAYMREKTGMTEAEVTREIERYVVWPAQATAYKTGQLAMLRMRDKAQQRLGDRFDLREFHETVLSNGGMPLGVLEDVVDEWIESKDAAS
ncbi:MAG: DUF885 domain-containing protein [Pseudomonadota bacterium]